MNYSLLTRLTGLLLVAGFFYSCATTQPSVDELAANNNYQQALELIQQKLENNPEQPALYIQKGKITATLAHNKSPEQRADLYNSTMQAFTNAAGYNATENQLATIDSLKQQYWKFEHNAGLRVFENQALSDRYEAAAIHFSNAILIKEDALSSYKNLAIAHYERGNIDEAINNFKATEELVDNVPLDIYENLGYLYLEKGNPDQAIYYYTLADQQVTDNFNISFGLVNAYISKRNHEKAVDLLEMLVDQNPQNSTLRNVYGTQLYEITATIMKDLRSAYQNHDSSMVEQIRFEAEGMGELAETQLIESFKRDTANTDYVESLAVFYNNLAAQYFALTNVAFETDIQQLNQKGLSLVDLAIRYYSMLTEADPQNSEYSTKLATLHTIKENRSTTE